MKPKNILFVTSGLGVGGAEVFLIDLVRKLIMKGVECKAISLKEDGALKNQLINAGCELISVPSRSLRHQLNLVPLVRNIIFKTRPEIVQGWMYHGNLVSTLATIGASIPVAWSVHHSLSDPKNESVQIRGILKAMHFLSKSPSLIHYCSNTSADQHREYGFSSIRDVIIPNGIDCNRFRPNKKRRELARFELGLEKTSTGPVIGHIARYHPMKDHECFLRAAARLHSIRKDVEFILIGLDVTDDNDKLVSLRNSLNLQNCAHFLGLRSDIPNLLHGMDLLSTSSAWGEAFPIVLGEAMASGIPCVATDIGDCAYLIGDTGRVVPPSVPKYLAASWNELLSEDKENRCKRQFKARQRILEHFSIEKITSAFVQQYERLL